MDRNECRFTVLFQPPFWVGIGERWTEEGYQAARVVFGAEPSDAQVYQWVLSSWHCLPFTAAEAGERPKAVPANPKRLQREAAKAARTAGASTKAQEALARQREADSLEAVLELKERSAAGFTAPPEGLCLMNVQYEEEK